MDYSDLEKRLSQVEKQLASVRSMLTFDEAAEFLGFSKSYLYKLTSTCQIPHYKPKGKMLYFEKPELMDWLKQNKVKTSTQIEAEAERYVLGSHSRKR